MAERWPTELILATDRKMLSVLFDDGTRHDLTAEYLRVMSPSAEVQGHSEAERKTVGGKRNVAVLSVQAVGNYAVRLQFDDMHASGIFSWGYLDTLGRERELRWAQYLGELDAKGLDRDRPGLR
jgi:DUF971 family protein